MAKLLTFQWQQEKYEWGIFGGPGFSSISPVLRIKIERNTLKKNVSMHLKAIIGSGKLFSFFRLIMQLWNFPIPACHWSVLTGIK